MRYCLKGRLIPAEGDTRLPDGAKLVEVLSSEEYARRHQGEPHQYVLLKSLKNIQFCKADLFKKCAVGTFVIPDKKDLSGKEAGFGFYMTQDELIFVDDENQVGPMLDQLVKIQIFDKEYIAHLLFEFMEYLVRDDVYFLQQYENRLAEIEEDIIKGRTKEFNEKLLKRRKELLVLESYYRQMMDVSEVLEENQNHIFTEEDCRVFHLFGSRVSRLYENVKMLKEYCLQLRELYQSQVDIRQNRIMQVLTIVTTIFFPLTLIAGWYGMNFTNMPELKAPYGYLVVTAVSFLIVLLEIWFFRRKHWLQ